MPYFVAIAGASGSGKSWLAERLAGQLPATIVSLDSYYRDLSHLEFAERTRQNFDLPEALDWELISSQIETLAQGRPIEKPVYDFSVHTRTSRTEPVAPADFMIIEGLFALYDDRVRRLCGTRVFLLTDDAVCLARRIERDIRERGRTRDSVIAQYAGVARPMYERHVLPTRSFADLVLSGADPVESLAAAVTAHAGNRLTTKTQGH